MKRNLSAEHAQRSMIRLCHSALDSRTLRIKLLERLQHVIPFDYTFFATTDPATLLFTGSVADETPPMGFCAIPGE